MIHEPLYKSEQKWDVQQNTSIGKSPNWWYALRSGIPGAQTTWNSSGVWNSKGFGPVPHLSGGRMKITYLRLPFVGVMTVMVMAVMVMMCLVGKWQLVVMSHISKPKKMNKINNKMHAWFSCIRCIQIPQQVCTFSINKRKNKYTINKIKINKKQVWWMSWQWCTHNKCVKCTAQVKTYWLSGYACFCKHTSQVASSNLYSYILNF